MSDLPYFSQRLKQLRHEAKMTQHELAQRSGVHHVNIAQIETGKRGPAWHTVMLLARALNVCVTAFVDPAIIPSLVEVKRGPGRPRIYNADTPRKRKRKGSA